MAEREQQLFDEEQEQELQDLDAEAKKTAEDDVAADEEYELVYDREGCIGAASCVAVFPEQWSLADDGLADYKKKFFGKDELERNLEAAKSCPVNVIRVKNRKTGEFLY